MKTNVGITVVVFLLLIASIWVSSMLIQVPEKIRRGEYGESVQPVAVTFIEEKNKTPEIPSDVYRRLKEAGLVDFAGFQAKAQD